MKKSRAVVALWLGSLFMTPGKLVNMRQRKIKATPYRYHERSGRNRHRVPNAPTRLGVFVLETKIISGAHLRVAKDLVRLIDLFESLLCCRIARIDVGM
jgi:hypothetical protein